MIDDDERGSIIAFANTGSGELRPTSIHGVRRFDTEWLAGPDPIWTSPRRP